MEIYEPEEDSRLLAAAVRKHAFGRVLDVGTGSGIQAEEALKKRGVSSVTASDVDRGCAAGLSSRIRFVRSDLFGSVPKQKFDTIIFNPPYLPQDRGMEDRRIYGGKKGFETIERFLGSAAGYLSGRGIVLLLFSSLTGKDDVDRIVEENCLEKEQVACRSLPFFEKLYVYRIARTELLRRLERRGVSGVRKFAEGNRGVIYAARMGRRKVAVKAVSARSPAKESVANEIRWLRVLNGRGIGPEVLASGKDYFVYRFVEGQYIGEWIESGSRREIVSLLKKVLEQCRAMDLLGVNKEEMLRPRRHVIVRSGEPVMLDFERCRRTARPKNVTQFCQYLLSTSGALRKKGILLDGRELIGIAKKYKKSLSRELFDEIVRCLEK